MSWVYMRGSHGLGFLSSETRRLGLLGLQAKKGVLDTQEAVKREPDGVQSNQSGSSLSVLKLVTVGI